jgi:hypothetical protein
MIRLNIISRIAGDKDFFSHYLETVSEIFSENNITIFVNFIGPIEDLRKHLFSYFQFRNKAELF